MTREATRTGGSEGAGLDPRLNAMRPDLADAALEGRFLAARYARGEAATILHGAADLRRAPDPALGIETQLLYGEAVLCFEIRDDQAWVQNVRDGYVGYVQEAALGKPLPAATHVVTALRTFVYPEPSLKKPVSDALSLTSPVVVVAEQAGYAELAPGGWVFANHLEPCPIGAAHPSARDHVATALRFLGMPYRWGGKETVGLDCSALVQLALQHAGLACPRDSDQQAAAVGTLLEDQPVERGDLLFFPGHVAIALDNLSVVHATAYTMQVCKESIAAVEARARAESGRGIIAHRRL